MKPVSKETFIELATMSNCNVLMLTHDGFYRQKDGLAKGSPPTPNLANGWLSQFDHVIKGEAKLYSRYMDDILREIKTSTMNQKLGEFNKLHRKLEFTVEREEGDCIPFLDMKIIHNDKYMVFEGNRHRTDNEFPFTSPD